MTDQKWYAVLMVRKTSPVSVPLADFHYQGPCLNEDPELFFPVGNSGPAALQIEEAKKVCGRCAVKEACLEWALEVEPEGVWGGMSEDERRAYKRSEARRSKAS